MNLQAAIFLYVILFFSAAQCIPHSSFPTRCEALAIGIDVRGYPNITVKIAKYLPANSQINHVTEQQNATCDDSGPVTTLPTAVCRLQLQVPTTNSSRIIMEAWLPENWSGRFLSTGNGGLGGCIQYWDIAYATSYGFAAVGTNNGHEGMSGGAFFHQPEVLRDFVWRAMYTGVVVGKSITKEIYGKSHKRSYYMGCSTGGRQGWYAVQNFPDMFDGVLVGAPAFNFLGIGAWTGAMYARMVDNTTEWYLGPEDWMKVHEETMRQCDGLDGAVDGLVEDGRYCKPDLTTLLCESGGNRDRWCLSRLQLSSVESIYSPFLIDGEWINGGLQPGTEFIQAVTLNSGSLSDWLKYVVKEDLSADPASLTMEDIRQAFQINPDNINTFEGDISRFRDRGGKVLHWHGQSDFVLPIANSDRYYETVAKTLSSSNRELDSFYRYFRISGLGHCNGGPGANAFGQGVGLNASDDPEDNVLTRIVAWVEEGRPPEFVRGTRFVNNDKAQGVDYTRRHCKYPLSNQYFGKGNGTDEKGWRCVRK
jgi:feruloyl esterase